MLTLVVQTHNLMAQGRRIAARTSFEICLSFVVKGYPIDHNECSTRLFKFICSSRICYVDSFI